MGRFAQLGKHCVAANSSRAACLSCKSGGWGEAPGQGRPFTLCLQGDSSEQGDELHKLRAALRAEKANSAAADKTASKLQEELAALRRQQSAALQVGHTCITCVLADALT